MLFGSRNGPHGRNSNGPTVSVLFRRVGRSSEEGAASRRRCGSQLKAPCKRVDSALHAHCPLILLLFSSYSPLVLLLFFSLGPCTFGSPACRQIGPAGALRQ